MEKEVEEKDITSAIRSSNKRTFRILQPLIRGYLLDHYEMAVIHRFLCEHKGMSMSYSQFTRYVKQYIGTVPTDKQRSIESDAKPEPKSGEISAPVSGKKSSGDRIFNHNPQAKTLQEFAFGKDVKNVKE